MDPDLRDKGGDGGGMGGRGGGKRRGEGGRGQVLSKLFWLFRGVWHLGLTGLVFGPKIRGYEGPSPSPSP